MRLMQTRGHKRIKRLRPSQIKVMVLARRGGSVRRISFAMDAGSSIHALKVEYLDYRNEKEECGWADTYGERVSVPRMRLSILHNTEHTTKEAIRNGTTVKLWKTAEEITDARTILTENCTFLLDVLTGKLGLSRRSTLS